MIITFRMSGVDRAVQSLMLARASKQPHTDKFGGVRDIQHENRSGFYFYGIKPSVVRRSVSEGLVMPDSLGELESRRAAVQSQLMQLSDMRAGSITGTGGRCGNPNCHCHQPGDPGHGPYSRLTRKVDGKTVTETFSSPAALAKAQREVAEYHRFRELGGQLLEVNEEICRLRPVEEPPLSAQEKQRPKRSARKSRAK